MRFLLVDAGNTRIKWGLTTPSGEIVVRGAMPTVDVASLATAWGEAAEKIEAAMFVSVAGDEVNAALARRLDVLTGGRFDRFLSTPVKGPLRNDYAQPAQLGADRLAAALGAWQRVRGDCLVVNCGTATTIDRVALLRNLQQNPGRATFGATARFAGGVILPGLSLMKASLFRNTARLPDAGGRVVVLPDNTDDAIETGCCLAQVGAMEALARQLPNDAPIVLSGGAADALLPLLRTRGLRVIAAPNLVLEGLAVAILERFSD